jgi:hypothetical protein
VNLHRPARGPRVIEVQKILNRLGFGPLEEDGVFGRGTESAVRLFQQAEKLDADGIVGPATMAALEGPKSLMAILSNEDEPEVVSAIRRLGHKVHEDGQCNIIGVRGSGVQSNSFDDKIHLAWKDRGWQHKVYPCTCDPGTYWLETPARVDGTAILCPGQYPVYKFDLHQGRYETLCQRAGKVKVWRDDNKDDVLDHDGDLQEGWFGINIHHAGADSSEVEKWSAGCQVFKRREDWREAMDVCKASGAEVFTYTLIDDKDLDS